MKPIANPVYNISALKVEASYRLLRSNCWFNHDRYCRSAIRDGSVAVAKYRFNGFRVLMEKIDEAKR